MSTVRSKWETSIKEVFPYFKTDEENESVVKLLQLWIARDPRFETVCADKNYSLNKGLMLHGNYGTGKTKLMQIVQRTIFLLRTEYQFKRFNMRELCQQYQIEGASSLKPENRHWFVDEFGLTEREPCNSYGNKVVIGDEVIGVRYDRFQSGYLTHLTTNLTYQQISDFYNARTVSRLHEMCNFIPLDGTDRRLTAKPQPMPKPVENKIDKKQVLRDWWQMIIREHARYKAGIPLMIIGSFNQFSHFEESGLIKLTVAEKFEWIEKAKLATAERIVDEKAVALTNRPEYKRMKSIREAIEAGALNIEQENEMKTLAIKMIIQEFYDSKTEEDFKVLINAVIERI